MRDAIKTVESVILVKSQGNISPGCINFETVLDTDSTDAEFLVGSQIDTKNENALILYVEIIDY